LIAEIAAGVLLARWTAPALHGAAPGINEEDATAHFCKSRDRWDIYAETWPRAAALLSASKAHMKVGVCRCRAKIHFFYDQLWNGILDEERRRRKFRNAVV